LISGDRNVIKKGAENIIKYEGLKAETQLMWNVKPNKCDTSNIRGNSKSLRKYLFNIAGKHEIKKLQKKFVLNTVHILREVLI
jgi:hypothetical protein